MTSLWDNGYVEAAFSDISNRTSLAGSLALL
jgi:hypothetical protein